MSVSTTSRPIEGLCPVCQAVFPYRQRKQGGGRRPIYCSHRCCALDWTRNNGGKRKASVTKYESVPVNQEKKRRRSRTATLAKYKWTEADLQRQLARQGASCYGCLQTLTTETARIDHNHATTTVRGLLCNSCNWGLGHLHENPAILRRLMAYLDYDLMKTGVYITGSLRNPRVPEVGNLLRAHGYEAIDEWYGSGPDADTCWQEYEKARGRTYISALQGRGAQNVFLFDKVHIDMADGVVLVAPAGKSSHLELGYAQGRGKATFVLLDGEPERYEVMPNFVTAVCHNEEALLTVLAYTFPKKEVLHDPVGG